MATLLRQLKDYKVGAKIGGGGDTSVHRATIVATGQPVILTAINVQNASDLLRAKDKAEILSNFLHPFVAHCLHYFEHTDDGRRWIYMEFDVAQWTLGDRISYLRDKSKLSANLEETMVQFAQLILAVLAAHAHGISHFFDIKPGNVLLLGGTSRLSTYSYETAIAEPLWILGIGTWGGTATSTPTAFVRPLPRYSHLQV